LYVASKSEVKGVRAISSPPRIVFLFKGSRAQLISWQEKRLPDVTVAAQASSAEDAPLQLLSTAAKRYTGALLCHTFRLKCNAVSRHSGPIL